MSSRRDFITLLGGAAAAWPLAARAQQPDRVRRIGVLMGYPENDSEAQAYIAAFRDGLRKLGWMEDRNIRIDTRWTTPGDADSIQRFAKELVVLQPGLILSNTTPTTVALLQQSAYHSHHSRNGCRSARQRLRRELFEARRKRHWFRHYRGLVGRQVGGATPRDSAAPRPDRFIVQPRNGTLCRILLNPSTLPLHPSGSKQSPRRFSTCLGLNLPLPRWRASRMAA